eukprot:6641842-Heterocapsa_arctica.AAC.1
MVSRASQTVDVDLVRARTRVPRRRRAQGLPSHPGCSSIVELIISSRGVARAPSSRTPSWRVSRAP